MVRPYYFVALFASFVALVLVGLLYTQHVQRDADRRWCSLLSTLDTNEPPAKSPRGREVQNQIHKLRKDLHCV